MCGAELFQVPLREFRLNVLLTEQADENLTI